MFWVVAVQVESDPNSLLFHDWPCSQLLPQVMSIQVLYLFSLVKQVLKIRHLLVTGDTLFSGLLGKALLFPFSNISFSVFVICFVAGKEML